MLIIVGVGRGVERSIPVCTRFLKTADQDPVFMELELDLTAELAVLDHCFWDPDALRVSDSYDLGFHGLHRNYKRSRGQLILSSPFIYGCRISGITIEPSSCW